jgi:hypothetical protein
MGDPTGEADKGALRLDFDRRLVLHFAVPRLPPMPDCYPIASWMTGGLTYTGGDMLADARTGKNGRHLVVGLLRQSVFGRLAG